MENLTAIMVNGMYVLATVMSIGAILLRKRKLVAGEPPELPFGRVPVWFFKRVDLWGVLGISLFFYLLAMSNAVLAGDQEMKLGAADVMVSICLQLLIAGVVVAVVVRRVGIVEWLGLAWRQWPWVFLIGPAVVVFMWVVFGFLDAMGYMEWLESMGAGDVQETVQVFLSEKDMVVVWLMAFAAVVVAPVCEEIVFRGYLYGGAKKFVGPWVACVATGLVFAAAHGNMVSMLPLFLFGMALALLYEFTGSIWAPMAVHFLFNGATVLVQMLVRYEAIKIPA